MLVSKRYKEDQMLHRTDTPRVELKHRRHANLNWNLPAIQNWLEQATEQEVLFFRERYRHHLSYARGNKQRAFREAAWRTINLHLARIELTRFDFIREFYSGVDWKYIPQFNVSLDQQLPAVYDTLIEPIRSF